MLFVLMLHKDRMFLLSGTILWKLTVYKCPRAGCLSNSSNTSRRTSYGFQTPRGVANWMTVIVIAIFRMTVIVIPIAWTIRILNVKSGGVPTFRVATPFKMSVGPLQLSPNRVQIFGTIQIIKVCFLDVGLSMAKTIFTQSQKPWMKPKRRYILQIGGKSNKVEFKTSLKLLVRI